MEQCPKFQWSVFNQDRSQQWVVRCNSFEEFLEAVGQLQVLLSGGDHASQADILSVDGVQNEAQNRQVETVLDFCAIHSKQMTPRTAKNGDTWYDHRWQEGTVWWRCNGKTQQKNEKGSK